MDFWVEPLRGCVGGGSDLPGRRAARPCAWGPAWAGPWTFAGSGRR